MYHNRGKHTFIKVLNVKRSESVNWSIQYFEKAQGINTKQGQKNQGSFEALLWIFFG